MVSEWYAVGSLNQGYAMKLDKNGNPIRLRDIKDSLTRVDSVESLEPQMKSSLTGKNKIPRIPKMNPDEIDNVLWTLDCIALSLIHI